MTDAASSPGPPPGWYPEPGGQPLQRWWNGTKWTDATRLSPQAPTAAPSPDVQRNGKASSTLSSPYSSRSSRTGRSRLAGRGRQLAWASVPVWSLGLLAFAPFLRLAVARRTAKDWGVFAAYLAAVAAVTVLISVAPTKGAGSGFAGGIIIFLMGFAAVHALISFRPAADGPSDLSRFSSSMPNQEALASAQARMQRRKEAREVALADPVLARELRIGRPDLPRQYDDGGLVDVNHVPVEIFTSLLDLTSQEAAAIAAARKQLGRFTSSEELSAYAQLVPDRVDAFRDLLLFG